MTSKSNGDVWIVNGCCGLRYRCGVVVSVFRGIKSVCELPRTDSAVDALKATLKGDDVDVDTSEVARRGFGENVEKFMNEQDMDYTKPPNCQF